MAGIHPLLLALKIQFALSYSTNKPYKDYPLLLLFKTDTLIYCRCCLGSIITISSQLNNYVTHHCNTNNVGHKL